MLAGLSSNTPMSNLGGPMNSGNIYGGSGFEARDMKLLNFAGLLCEFSEYNSDLKAILENSKLFTEQNQNQHSGVSPYANNGQITDNLLLSNNGNYNSTGSPDPNSSTNFKTIEGPNNKINDAENESSTIGSNVNSSGSEYITSDSIYNLLTSQWTIWIDTSKLPKYLRKIVNELVNNNDLNNSLNNQSGNLITSNTPFSSKNALVDKQNNKQLVFLNADQFQDLIYYFIINAVAKENGMTVTNNIDHSGSFNKAEQEIQTLFNEISSLGNNEFNAGTIYDKASSAQDSIDKTVSGFKNNVENGELQKIIKGNVENKNESSGFWSQFLFSVLKRAFLIYSIIKSVVCSKKLKAFNASKDEDENIDKTKFIDQQKLKSDLKNHIIDTILSIPNVLLLLSWIFGFGAIVNVMLGLIILATLVYKFINQWPKSKQKFLIYKLLQSNRFADIAQKNGSALIPEVAKIYQYGEQVEQNVKTMSDFKLKDISQNMTPYASGIPLQYTQQQNLFA